MAIFDFPYHTQSTDYPQSGDQAQMGGGYQYSVEPSGPPQRTFTLYFETMLYYKKANGDLDREKTPHYNLALLDDFYREHELWKTFEYDHPVYGPVLVKFNKPLKIPEGVKGGMGTVKPFTIELIEQP